MAGDTVEKEEDSSEDSDSSSEASEDDSETSENVEKPYVCYLLRSANQRRTYTGVTVDLCRRLGQHNGLQKGGARSTHAGRPWSVLCATSGFSSKVDALRFEWRLKRRPAVNSKKLRPVNGGLSLRCKNVYDVLSLDRWTSSCQPASDTPLVLTWYDTRWRPQSSKLPSHVTERIGNASELVPPKKDTATLKRPAAAAVAKERASSYEHVLRRPAATLDKGTSKESAPTVKHAKLTPSPGPSNENDYTRSDTRHAKLQSSERPGSSRGIWPAGALRTMHSTDLS